MLLRRIVALHPKKAASSGAVATPTIIRVETNTAIYAIPAPFSTRILAMGKAMNPGINVSDPIIEVNI